MFYFDILCWPYDRETVMFDIMKACQFKPAQANFNFIM